MITPDLLKADCFSSKLYFRMSLRAEQVTSCWQNGWVGRLILYRFTLTMELRVAYMPSAGPRGSSLFTSTVWAQDAHCDRGWRVDWKDDVMGVDSGVLVESLIASIAQG